MYNQTVLEASNDAEGNASSWLYLLGTRLGSFALQALSNMRSWYVQSRGDTPTFAVVTGILTQLVY